MSLSGPVGPRSPLAAYGVSNLHRAERPQAAAPSKPTAAPVAASAPSDVPAGSDPKLWAVLTSEEKAFFARQSQMGPVTYGPSAQRVQSVAMADAPRGLRLDVKG